MKKRQAEFPHLPALKTETVEKITVENLYSHPRVEWSDDSSNCSPYRAIQIHSRSDDEEEMETENGLQLTEANISHNDMTAPRNLGWSKFVKDEVGWESNKRRIYGYIREKYYTLCIFMISDNNTAYNNFMIDEKGYVYMRLINYNYTMGDNKDPDIATSIMWRVDCIANDDVCSKLKKK